MSPKSLLSISACVVLISVLYLKALASAQDNCTFIYCNIAMVTSLPVTTLDTTNG